jgi:hypothetical protein
MKNITGKECKKTDCIRHESYVKWQCGDSNLNFCMKCKWARPSQFTRKPKEQAKQAKKPPITRSK